MDFGVGRRNVLPCRVDAGQVQRCVCCTPKWWESELAQQCSEVRQAEWDSLLLEEFRYFKIFAGFRAVLKVLFSSQMGRGVRVSNGAAEIRFYSLCRLSVLRWVTKCASRFNKSLFGRERQSSRDGTEARKIDESLYQEKYRQRVTMRDFHVLQQGCVGSPPKIYAIITLQRRHSLSNPYKTIASKKVKLVLYRFSETLTLNSSNDRKKKIKIQVSGSPIRFALVIEKHSRRLSFLVFLWRKWKRRRNENY